MWNTFENDQDQSHISERQESLLPMHLQDIGQRDAVDNAHGDVANNPGADDLGGHPFGQGEDEKEGYDDKDFNDYAC